MGFADGYLQKHALRPRLIKGHPDPELKIIVTIPCYNESGLLESLDSLFLCDKHNLSAEVIILINATENSSEEILRLNRDTYNKAVVWIGNHTDKSFRFFPVLDNAFPSREAGVGLARKILMDEAARRFNLVDHPDGIILSLDADALVEPGYLVNVLSHFHSNPGIDGCSIYFEHPLSGDEFSNTVYDAVSLYELHLRYHVRATRYTGYPYAFHTVGSCFGVRASAYCKYGGMNRRPGGEDFYFIQKVAQNGKFSDCTSTCIMPSPRPSDRVPFGTGPAVINILSDPGKPFRTYHPEGFIMLKEFFGAVKEFSLAKLSGKPFSGEKTREKGLSEDIFTGRLHPVLRNYLGEIDFEDALAEIWANTASPDAFMKRFRRYFNMFRILKFLHFAREKGIEDMPVADASKRLLELLNVTTGKDIALKDLLAVYRGLDRSSISSPHP